MQFRERFQRENSFPLTINKRPRRTLTFEIRPLLGHIKLRAKIVGALLLLNARFLLTTMRTLHNPRLKILLKSTFP